MLVWIELQFQDPLETNLHLAIVNIELLNKRTEELDDDVEVVRADAS